MVAGVHGRWSNGKLRIKATVAYDGGNADTRRNLLGASANGSYDLTGWTGDLSLTYAMPLSRGWTVQPTVGLTAIRTIRDQVAEGGDSPYVLEVARERDHAVFVDGGLTFKGGMQDGAAMRPYLTVGMRYQVEGRAPFALAALGGGDLGLAATGASRAPVLATATMGTDVVLSSSLTLFGSLSGEAGDADRRASARVGLRLAF
ncbi:autotransporter outer membrane beta-barrel domain-containing protein [Sphingobium fuliginis]|uniref:autotransporter outer membrane beta-barrel domain-containing protein n=1 Tax=Sphingobium fuliginis (strain ATCC 27551) TaxID=336203 RepID=UPI001430D2BF|nr:autotransporter outer membrane beta-barrel domain-containing protein [Sphingobium fuliginis]